MSAPGGPISESYEFRVGKVSIEVEPDMLAIARTVEDNNTISKQIITSKTISSGEIYGYFHSYSSNNKVWLDVKLTNTNSGKSIYDTNGLKLITTDYSCRVK
jgi:hypothetical protein